MEGSIFLYTHPESPRHVVPVASCSASLSSSSPESAVRSTRCPLPDEVPWPVVIFTYDVQLITPHDSDSRWKHGAGERHRPLGNPVHQRASRRRLRLGRRQKGNRAQFHLHLPEFVLMCHRLQHTSLQLSHRAQFRRRESSARLLPPRRLPIAS